MEYIISKRAQVSIENELNRFPDTETGGLLLGYSDSEKGISVLEATDSGYQNTIHEVGSFQYDFAYEEHLCNLLSQLYQPPLQLVGVWHKHNNAMRCGDRLPFSRSDEKMHAQLMENNYPCLSILFEKCSGTGEAVTYKTSVYLLSLDGKHQNVTDFIVWSNTLCTEF